VKILSSEIRGPGLISPMARVEYRALTAGQPVTLRREPDNAKDGNAIVVETFLRQPCGYLARQQAAILAPLLDAGERWEGEVTAGAHAFRCPQVLLRRK
jgi:hypothetical protein